MKILHIDSSLLGEKSVSRAVSAAVVGRLKSLGQDASVVYRDLVARPLPHLTLSYLPTDYPLAGGAVVADPAEEHRATSQAVLDEFMDADIVVIGAPMYNFTVPSQLKAWIDRIVIAGKTFRYTADGQVVGLAEGKRVIVAVSRGGFYGTGTPGAAAEHLETYLRAIFEFVGVKKLEFVVAEGIQISPAHRSAATEGALRIASEVSAA